PARQSRPPGQSAARCPSRTTGDARQRPAAAPAAPSPSSNAGPAVRPAPGPPRRCRSAGSSAVTPTLAAGALQRRTHCVLGEQTALAFGLLGGALRSNPLKACLALF